MTMSIRELVMVAALVGAAAAAPPAAHAQVPAAVPVQGVLTDGNGTPLAGNQQVRFRIYDVDSGGTALYDETQLVGATAGAFTAYLGAIVPLNLGIFTGGDRWLGITVGTDAEMTPRLRIGSVPYAAYAGECASVPAGAVMHFDLAACPAGWSELTAARGRTIVGLPAAGTLDATVGTALADKGLRSITQVPMHSHVITAYAGTTTSDGAHTPTMVSGGGAHSHTIDLGEGSGLSYRPYWSGQTQPNVGDYATPVGGTHTHTMNAVPSHSHSFTVPSASTQTTGVGSVDVTMPYVQLLTCRKD
jgi:hypothetical protein